MRGADMKFRPLDENRDMIPCFGLLEGKEAVGAALASRFRLYYGEWWEDRTLGFRVPEFLIRGARRGQEAMLASYITAFIRETEGVTGVLKPVTEIDGHDMKFTCSINTAFGQEKAEVDNYVLLSAVL